MLKAVIYARISTEDRTVENQLLILREYAKGKGIKIVGEFVDVGVSGYEVTPERRDGWLKAVEAAKQYNAALLVFSLDRVARKYDYLVKALEDLRANGIQVIAYQEEWLQFLTAIPDEALRKLIFDIVVRALAYGYQKYVESLKDKIKAGMERARQKGKHVGRPSAVPDEFLIKLLKKYQGLSKKDLWRITIAEGYKISYPRFIVKINKILKGS
ncbi:MAG: recombinase family protein [Candidatus Bathyarchaeia archaeon]